MLTTAGKCPSSTQAIVGVRVHFMHAVICRIVANFAQYDIVVRNCRHANHPCIPELILKRDKASFVFQHEMVMKADPG